MMIRFLHAILSALQKAEFEAIERWVSAAAQCVDHCLLKLALVLLTSIGLVHVIMREIQEHFH